MGNKSLHFDVVGSNCVDCGLILKGIENTSGAMLCRMLYDAIRKGEASVKMRDEKVIFAVNEITFNFPVPENRLRAVKSLLEQRTMCLEPIDEINYVGFVLSRNY